MKADHIEQFRKAMSKAGMAPPNTIISDGSLHHFCTGSNSNKESGWYVYHDGDIPAGAFGDFRTDTNEKWRANIGREYTVAENTENTERMNAIQKKHKAQKAEIAAEASVTANEIWDAAARVKTHIYLSNKGVKAYGIKQYRGSLVIPMLDAYGTIHSLQYIKADGNKRFLSGGRVKGCYFSIGDPDQIIYICEGYATGASIHEATGEGVVVAFNAGNLPEVAQAIRAKFTDIEIVICGDDDVKS